MAESARKIFAPTPTPETQAFWDAAAKGQLLVKRCTACGRAHHYPRPICPFCGSDRTEWKDATGMGVIYSFSVMRRSSPPYVIAYVTLDEGVRMMTNIVDTDLDTIRIGQRVKVVFKKSEAGLSIPMFAPA